MSFQIKKGDTLPSLQGTITDEDGVALDLTGATVMFSMRGAPVDCDFPCGQLVTLPSFKKAAVVITPSPGIVRYDFASGDTDTAGEYVGEFKVTIGGRTWTAPTVGAIPITILDALP